MNSTHAAWLNGILVVLGGAFAAAGQLPNLPPWAIGLVLAGNAALHAILPDAPPGAGITGSKR